MDTYLAILAGWLLRQNEIPVHRGEHEHTQVPKREEGLQRNCVSRMKDAARSGTIPINYSQVLHGSSPLASATLLSKSSLLATLYRVCRSHHPAIPQRLVDLEIPQDTFSHTGANYQDRFLISNTITDVNGSFEFATDEGTCWLVD